MGAPGADQWGQQQGGWQQNSGWGSAVPPMAMPGGLAPGSPMGQTNVFPTAETVDPITGMPISLEPGADNSSTDTKRLLLIVGGALLVGLLVLFLIWFLVLRSSGSSGAAGTTTGEVEVTATYLGEVDPACADLGAALTADGLSATVAQRLGEVATAKNLEENQAYFQQLAKDVKPIMNQYQSACVSAVSAGDAPEFYRTFVTAFQSAVNDGASVSTTALANSGTVPPADAERLRSQASTLASSAKAVAAVSGSPAPTAPVPTPTAAAATPSAVAGTPAATPGTPGAAASPSLSIAGQ